MAPGRRKQEVASSGTRAAESGARIQHSRQNIRERQADRAESARQFDKSADQRDQDLWNRQWQQRRADRAARDAERAKNQAAKPRTTNFGNEGMDPNQGGDPKLDEAKRQFDERQAQQQSQFDQTQALNEAKAGFQRGGGAGGDSAQDQQRVAQALEQNPNDPRLQKMMQEMQRGAKQMGMGVEQTGRRGLVPTPEALEKSRMDAGTARMNADTARQNAMIRKRELALKAQKLEAEANSGGPQSKEATAALAKVNKAQAKDVHNAVNLQIAFSTNKGTDKQWDEIQQVVDQAVEEGVAGEMLERQAEVSRREYGPALKSFLAERSMTEFVDFVSTSQGRFPEGIIPDVSTEAWQEFTRNGKVAAQMLRAGLNAELYPAQETEQWKRMVNMLAAGLTKTGKGKAMQLPEQARTSQSDVMRGSSGQLQEEAELPGGGTTRRQVYEGDPADLPGKEKIPPKQPTQRYGTRGGLSGNLPYGV